jgi:hypothetical protein
LDTVVFHLGSNAGYDSIEECFRDLSEHIFALETGLSSDPAMNWKLSALDKYSFGFEFRCPFTSEVGPGGQYF